MFAIKKCHCVMGASAFNSAFIALSYLRVIKVWSLLVSGFWNSGNCRSIQMCNVFFKSVLRLCYIKFCEVRSAYSFSR